MNVLPQKWLSGHATSLELACHAWSSGIKYVSLFMRHQMTERGANHLNIFYVWDFWFLRGISRNF